MRPCNTAAMTSARSATRRACEPRRQRLRHSTTEHSNNQARSSQPGCSSSQFQLRTRRNQATTTAAATRLHRCRSDHGRPRRAGPVDAPGPFLSSKTVQTVQRSSASMSPRRSGREQQTIPHTVTMLPLLQVLPPSGSIQTVARSRHQCRATVEGTVGGGIVADDHFDGASAAPVPNNPASASQ